MTPGELYWVEFPPSDGHEQAGRRPALVLHDEGYAGGLPLVFVAPVTGTLRNLRYAATVQVDPSDANGMYKPSVVLVFQARGLDRRRLSNRIGVVSPPVLASVYDALADSQAALAQAIPHD